MGNNSFGPFSSNPNCFIVRNVAPVKKTIMIFNYPINHGETRDLIKIPGVAESDIRSSLLKGELNHKIRAEEIVVLCSDIDLLQFNLDQKLLLQSAGIVNGLDITSENLAVIRRDDITLIGIVDGVNTIFSTPEKFLFNSTYKIIVYLNGVKQAMLDDYFISESGGPGTGYDLIVFTTPPESAVLPADFISADYYVNNI